jgi:uncharacterized protein YjbI with pentapeptide repeats
MRGAPMKLPQIIWLTCLGVLVSTPTGAQQQPQEEMSCPHPRNWKPTNDELQRVVSEHRRWTKKEHYEVSDDPPDGSEGRANLCNADLRNAELNKANLAWAVLNNAYFESAKLNEAILFGAQLNGAILWKAQLNRADLRRAQLNGAILWKAQLNRADLRRAQLNEAFLKDAQLNEAMLSFAQLNNATLSGAQLNRAELINGSLKEALLLEAEMNEINLFLADLNKAKMQNAKLNKAVLALAKLDQAILSGSSLNEANLFRASVAGAHLDNVDLTGAHYAPTSAALDPYVAGIKGLETVTFLAGEEVGLVQLRDLLQKAGLRDLERQATFAIENGRTRNSIAGWKENRWGAAEGVFRKIAFDFTTRYGLNPARAVLTAVTIWALLIPVYSWPIWRQPRSTRASGIYRMWPKDRVEVRDGKPTLDNPPRVERLHARGLATIGWSAYFSLLSAFQIGFREFSVGTWLTRVQPHNFALEATGWIRILSGLQSLLSVYLFAMWLLTYFGRPFQ